MVAKTACNQSQRVKKRSKEVNITTEKRGNVNIKEIKIAKKCFFDSLSSFPLTCAFNEKREASYPDLLTDSIKFSLITSLTV